MDHGTKRTVVWLGGISLTVATVAAAGILTSFDTRQTVLSPADSAVLAAAAQQDRIEAQVPRLRRAVEHYLRSVARDPSSVVVEGCTAATELWGDEWEIACDWRARNGFGGMNREMNWFVVRNGRVVAMQDAPTPARRYD